MLDQRWNTFLVLCETMNYTRAAERLCLTQPAVTHHIHYLEDYYGCRLFSYEGKVLRLTEAGVRLREFTRSMAYNARKVETTMAAPTPISLRVGASKTIGEYLIAPKVERFLRAQPEAAFSLLVDNTQVLLRELEAGQLDFILIEGFFDRSRYDSRLYRNEAFFGVCAPGHRLAGRKAALEELAGERLILREPGSGTRAIFEEALFRGVLLHAAPPWAALPLSSLLFGLAHGPDAFALPLALLGWCLGLVTLRARSLLPAILLHALFNLLALLLALL